MANEYVLKHTGAEIDTAIDTILAEDFGTLTATQVEQLLELLKLKSETWTFTLEDGSTVTKAVYVG